MANETEIERLIVRLIGDGSLYQKMMTQAMDATTQAAKHIEDISKKIEGFQGSIQKFSKTALGLLGSFGVASSLKGAFNKFEDLEQNQIRMKNSLEGNGVAVKETTAEYARFGAEIAKTTTLSKGQTTALLKTASDFGKTGQAAEDMATIAIGLAGATGQSAQEMMGVARALENGDTRALRHIQAFRGITDQAQLLATAQRLVAQGLKTEAELAKTATAQMDKLGKSLGEITTGVGGLVAEVISPLIDFLLKATNQFKAMDPAVKKVVVVIVALMAALPLLGPAFASFLSILATLSGPALAALGVIKVALLALLSPIGLIVAAVATLTAAWVYYSGAGGEALNWFTEQFHRFSEYLKPAIDGIKNALKAGDVVLAFKILWAQVQLTFADAAVTLRETWVGFVFVIKSVWAGVVAWIKSTFEELTNFSAKTVLDMIVMFNKLPKSLKDAAGLVIPGLEDLANKVNQIGAAGVNNVRNRLDRETQERLKEIEKEKNAAINAAQNAGADQMQAIKDNLKALEAERNKLIQEANAAAAALPPPKPIVIPEIKLAKKSVDVKVNLKFDAAEFGSVEAISRIRQFMEDNGIGAKGKRRKGLGAVAEGLAGNVPAAVNKENQGEPVRVVVEPNAPIAADPKKDLLVAQLISLNTTATAILALLGRGGPALIPANLGNG